MATLPLEGFGGIAPLINQRKLPPQGATIALDCLFEGSDLRPLRASVAQEVLGFSISRLFKYIYQGSGYWLAWPSPYVVDVVPSPIAQDELGRLYWSRYNPSSPPPEDNYPRCASQPTQSAITNNTAAIRQLGIPAPTDSPDLTESQTNSVVTPVTMSQTSPVTVTTAEDHPFEDGQRVVVVFETVAEGDASNMSELNGLEFIVGDSEARQFILRGSDGENYSEFTDNTGVTIERVYGDSDLETRSYVYTYVSDWGEEGAPCPPTDPVDVRYDSAVDLSIPTNPAAPFSTYINRVRIYRTASGTQGAQFFYVGEIAIASMGTPVVFTDDVDPIALGEILPSTDWAMPPNGLQGLVQMPNGFLAGFVGNTLYFSEPYMPHAWPDRYRKTVTDDIVGMAVYGQTLVVATKGQPYIATGTDPGSVSTAKLDVYAPCLAKSGLCSIGMGVAYPSYDGLVIVSASGAQVITQTMITKAQWAAAWDAGMSSVWHDGRLIALSTNSSKPTLIFQPIQGVLNISTSTIQGTAGAVDDDDTMHYASGVTRVQFDAGGALTAAWQSRVFTLSAARSMGVGQVFASGYPVSLEFGYANLASPGGQPSDVIVSSFTSTVNGPEPFRLPDGFLSREWRIKVTTAHAVQRIVAAEVMDELR